MKRATKDAIVTMLLAALTAIAVAVAAGALAVWIVPGKARAHGAYAWIMQRYPECCGPKDCFEVPAARVAEDALGFQLLDYGEHVPRAQVRKSEDGRYWRCHNPSGLRRCFFAPPAGS